MGLLIAFNTRRNTYGNPKSILGLFIDLSLVTHQRVRYSLDYNDEAYLICRPKHFNDSEATRELKDVRRQSSVIERDSP